MPGREYRQDKPPRFCSRACKSRGLAGISLKPQKYPISPELHEAIKRVYQNHTGNGEVNALAKSVGYPRWKISRYAITQGWLAKTKKAPDWIEEELAILERWAHLTPENIHLKLKAAGFKRSYFGITIKRKRMRFLKNLRGQSAISLSECFGVDMKVVTRWIKLGYLKARRRGTARTERQGGDHWFIKDKWIRDFVVDNVAVIDLRKVDKYWLVDLLTNKPGG